MSVRIETKAVGLARATAVISKLGLIDMTKLLDGVGQMIENQTKRRIQSEKKAPDGTPWQPWSESYAKTRHGGHSLLQNDGHLLESIQHLSHLSGVEVGSNLAYAAAHQLGIWGSVGRSGGSYEILPARPYLGLNQRNVDAIDRAVTSFIKKRTGV